MEWEGIDVHELDKRRFQTERWGGEGAWALLGEWLSRLSLFTLVWEAPTREDEHRPYGQALYDSLNEAKRQQFSRS